MQRRSGRGNGGTSSDGHWGYQHSTGRRRLSVGAWENLLVFDKLAELSASRSHYRRRRKGVGIQFFLLTLARRFDR
ncbi:hypothetical protein BDW67DRAFT_162414 [Aspergillus spinulosporus]